MVRRKARWKKPEPKLLATLESRRVVRCYALEGKAHIHRPILGETVLVVLVNAARETRQARGTSSIGVAWACEVDVLGEWRVLGWLPPSGQLRHGELENVDPELADWDRLPRANELMLPTHSIRPMLVIDIVPWDADGKPEYDG